MKGLDDGPDGLNDAAWERALRQPKAPRVVIDRCPDCGRPAHASETDDAGFHPPCARLTPLTA